MAIAHSRHGETAKGFMAKVLIVDDNVDMLDTLEHLFMFYDFEVARAENGQIGLEQAESENPDIIILDALMPVMNGFDACSHLKSSPRTRHIPVIFLSANYTDKEHRQRGIDLGADDYILKPFNAKDLIAKVTLILRKKHLLEEIRTDNQSLLTQHRNRHPELEDVRKRSDVDVQTKGIDSLTGLYDLDAFTEKLDSLAQNSDQANAHAAVILMDVDNFQKINNGYGEQIGDYILMRIANVILKHSRVSDTIFRLAKNKFGILLPQTEEKTAFFEAERIRTVVHQTEFLDASLLELTGASRKRQQNVQNITVSIGVSSLSSGISKNDFLKQAEEALSRAKSLGRNTTIRFSETVN